MKVCNSKINQKGLVFLALFVGGAVSHAQHYHRRSTVVVEGHSGGLAASSATSATWISLSASTVAAHHKAVEYVRVQDDAVAVTGGGAAVSAMLRLVMNEEKQVLASQLGESVSVQASDQDLVRLVQIKAGALSNSKPVGSSPAQLGAVERFAIAVERVELAKQFGQDVAKFSDSDILEMVEIKGQISR